MEDLYANQQQIVEAIETAFTNFKKDGADRKTSDYIKRKVGILESYWSTFQMNHQKMCGFGVQTHSYFTSQQYEVAREKYERIKSIMESYRREEPSIPSTPLPKAATPLMPPRSLQEFVSRGTNSKIDEMLKRQASNFKAFKHTISTIDLAFISEKWELEDVLKTIQNRWSVIDKLHWELDSELEGTEAEYVKSFTEYEQSYNNIKKQINSKIWSMVHRDQSTPRVEVPVFTGSYQQWVPFRNLFMETIHMNPSLSQAQKMQFLKTKVMGDPEKLIQHLEISAENYVVCWDILNHRFNNKKSIFTSHINSLMNIPTAQQPLLSHLKRIHDTTKETVNAIKNLGVDTTTWDPLLVHILSQKLDTETYNDYAESLKHPRELPILQKFLDFLEGKFIAMESRRRQEPYHQLKPYQSQSKPFKKHVPNNNNYFVKNYSNKIEQPFKESNSSKNICPLCNNNHGLFYCQQFHDMTTQMKKNYVHQKNLCHNCLYDHKGKICYSESKCKKCNAKHNTLMHEAFASQPRAQNRPTSYEQNQHFRGNTHDSTQNNSLEVLLATAIIKVKGINDNYISMRALIDQGSQTSLITEKAAQLLGLSRRRCHGVISGVGTKETSCKGLLNLECQSTTSDFVFNTDVFIMNNLISNLPSTSFSEPNWPFLNDIKLADPEFNRSRPVDILFGADVYSTIILEGICRSEEASHPVAQQTRLGWILCGNVKTSFQCNVIINDLEEIKKFWEVEDITDQTSLSSEDQQCIEFYNTTTKRCEDGRYEVRVPLKPNFEKNLGESKQRTVAQFLQLERKFCRNKVIEVEYKNFILEYMTLGHMKIAINEKPNDCYLPHHCVQRLDSTSTKHRVVFNASQKTSTGNSLNDVMYRGPNLQQDLQALILKWRQFPYAITADIEKMFRQIRLNEEDQKYHKIIWRENSNQILQEYQLATVTYGTKAAPFLAMMTLKRLADDEREKCPEAAQVLENYFYMDDLVHGSFSVDAAKKLKQDLMNLLKLGGFHLRKWASNVPELAQEPNKTADFDFKYAESTNVFVDSDLGLKWNPENDVFTFQLEFGEPKKHTKRSLSSDVSKLFDPLGWLSPLCTKLKLLFQNTWLSNIDWDEELLAEIIREWNKIREDIKNINKLKIERWIKTNEHEEIQLHGYCDASTLAFACVIYCRVSRRNETAVTLLCAKTRLVPAGKDVSLPRLELCGAVLLAKLMDKVKKCFNNFDIKTYGWTDSMVVLGWLNGQPNKWKTFVANRVNQVVETMPPECWHYVKSSENPADSASRGSNVTQLSENTLWWQGPSWLKTIDDKTLSNHKTNYQTNVEIKTVKKLNTAVTQNCDVSILQQLILKYSSFTQVTRVLAWIYRFITSSKQKQRNQQNTLTLKEINQAKTMLIKHVQAVEFSEEIGNLKKNKQLSTKSKILNLNPYLDEEGVLRVGGRLNKANLEFEMTHPAILPRDNQLTNLIIQHNHKLTLHGGARVTSASIRQKYWVVGGNRVVKKELRKCVTCRKFKAENQKQIMGDLPSSRCNMSRPFYHTGVDFTGFVEVKSNKGRGVKTSKGYIAVFVCMATKAVHLELVSDLTSSTFLAALRRMAARRGTPRHLYSDNGTNFIGSSKILETEYLNVKQMINQELASNVSDMEIKWHFNAPSWPSAGGLWEAAVKSVKFHLKRVIGQQKLTYEEYATLLSQIEAVLNSRPLCALTEDPDDLEFLSPSSFLSSGPNLTLVESERDGRTRWYLTEKIFENVWKRWQSEYLNQLTTRSKWHQMKENIKIDDVVVIHDTNLPAGKWAIGRVIELHPGNDGCVRVVTLKTKNGYLKRPVTKLSILPVQDTEQKQTSDSENQQKDKQSYKKPKTFSILSSISYMLFLMTLFTTSHCAINHTQLREGQGFYFDKVTNMQLVRDEWKIVVYFDMAPYWQGISSYYKYVQQLEQTCVVMKETPCDALLYQLRHGYSEIQYYNNLLCQQSPAPARQRRGLIDGVGYLANNLFGVLDERFAEQYRKDIKFINANQDHLATLWKNQTSVIEAEYNLLKRTEDTMNKQQKLINQHFLRLEQTLRDYKKDAQNLAVIYDFTLAAILASNMLRDLEKLQETLLDTVTDIYHGNINPHLITPEQLRQELSIISSQLPKQLSLPVNNVQTDLRTIYQLLKVKTRTLQDYLLFEIRLPLITRDTYEIFKIIEIPQRNGDICTITSPISEYVAINIGKDSYLPMTINELGSCIPHEIYLCKLAKPTYHMKSEESLCEQEQPKQCKFIKKPCQSKWIELSRPNNYFFFCYHECHLKIICEDDLKLQTLTATGIVDIDIGCSIISNDFTIYAHNPHKSLLKVYADVKPLEIHPINNIVSVSVPTTEASNDEISSSNERELKNIKESIEILKQASTTTELSVHDVHQYSLLYIILAVGGVTGVAFLWRCLRRRCSAAVAPAAAGACSELEAPALAPRSLNQLEAPPPRSSNSDIEMVKITSARMDKCSSPVFSK